MMPNACNQDMHEGKRIYTHLYDCLGLLGGEWLSVGVAIASASQWMMVVQCNQVKTPPRILVGLKESIDLSASTWLWPWVGTFEIERCPPNSRPFCRAGFTTREIIINIHQLYCTYFGSYWILIVPIGYHWIPLALNQNHRPVPARLADWPSIGWHRVTGVTGDPHCTGRSFEALHSGPWTTHRFGMILMSFWIYVSIPQYGSVSKPIVPL